MNVRIRGMAIVIACITIARIVYNVWLSPYELLADEAQYWDWSRHLDWSYYSKGPGVAWLLALTTRVLGNAEWAIRTPAALSFAVVMGASAWLTLAMFPKDGRAASTAPLLVCLVPAYQLSALLMTIDAPYLACWSVALCAAWRAWALERAAAPRVLPWMIVGSAVGVGFLFKYTSVLLAAGLIVFIWLDRASLRSGWWRRGVVASLAAVVTAAPVAVWNVRHHAAGLSHLLGYLHLPAGDRSIALTRSPIVSAAEFPAVQFAVIGPALVLMWLGARALREAREDEGQRAVRFALCMSLPMLVVFGVAAFRTRIEANWPMAAFLSLVPLAAVAAAGHRHRGWWSATMVYGAIGLAAIHMPLFVARAPVVGKFVPVHRFAGNRDFVSTYVAGIAAFQARAHGTGVIVAAGHNQAGMFAYYLPGRPTVASAGRYFGLRPSAYDFFDDTHVFSPKLAGRPALLVGDSRGPMLMTLPLRQD